MNAPTLLADRYELLKQLGRGGMARVYLARDLRLERTVAVKTLLSDHAQDSVFQERFQREARAVASLNHPAIAAVYDTGEAHVDGTDLPFIVMEYVEGSTLSEVLAEGPMAPQEALRVCSGVLSALAYSHEHGIVHRDIKPANVMLTTDGQVKVMDFGIARAMGAGGMTMTQTSTVIGTAHYLSPEQARGEKVDARSDLYSAGCLLYELLTMRPPFDGESVVAVAYQHVTAEPQPPSTITGGLTRDMDDIVLGALAKGRDERYQTADDMRADIEALLGHSTQVPGATRRTAAVPSAAHGGGQPADGGDGRRGRRAERQQDDDRRKKTIAIAAGVFVLVAALVAFSSSLFGGSGDRFALPDLVGLEWEKAQEIADEHDLTAEAGDERRACGQAESTVCATDPAPGTDVEAGSTVTVVLSDGSDAPDPDETVEVPDVVGSDVDAARAELEELDLTVAQEPRETSDAAPGTVLEQTPEGGSEAAAGSTVTLTVAAAPSEGSSNSGGDSAPESPSLATVPGVTDLPFEQAQAELAAVGLTAARSDTEDDRPAGQVIGQEPAAGAQVASGSTVTVTVSTGPQASATVPHVVGVDPGSAAGQIESAGLSAQLDPSCQMVGALLRVTATEPGGGQPATAGSAVTVRCEIVPDEGEPEPPED
ncbi:MULTISPECIES: Stk1 family PASTA domain-containing Ser/Thr kinase [unclassified Streptomyces]|uniref:Stk1 family PASTA domain-containing Ser/Thr kinase n=1 Tax=unclassified Streptomyces TaxID=2593676 RepID=UPI000CD54026|nr:MULTISPECIES: Stk1 family PASTA domain-containing Ser/Thr kinase [unclassified Streptomyces]